MNSKEIFDLLVSKVPDTEYLFFEWSGGGDDWTGFKFIKGQNASGVIETIPTTLDDTTVSELNNSSLLDELSLAINCTDQGWSEGVLLVALRPLSEDFEDDRVVYLFQEAGFKGFALAGKNHEEIGGSMGI